MAALRVLHGDGEGSLLSIEAEFTLGRATSNTFHIPAEGVSRNHARIAAANGIYTLTDLGSSNGTFVEREGRRWQIAPDIALRDGDIIAIGPASFRFEAGTATQIGMADTARTMVGRIVPTRESGK